MSDQKPLSNKDKLSYKSAGVDIDKANQLVSEIGELAGRTHRPGVIGGIGGFGALYEIPLSSYQQPVLVSGTDGVGTKLKLAADSDKLDGIGIDLVAMCANDIICLGAEPLYFLDYYATGKLELERSRTILRSIADGCEQAGAALIGGETAELPGMYTGGDFDLAGFCVGIVDKNKIIDGSQVHIGDPLIAIASSGAHANGYSLIRQVLEKQKMVIDPAFARSEIGQALLRPTRIYSKAIACVLKSVDVHAIAHITGGGLLENIPRILPDHTQAIIDTTTWEWPRLFQWLQTSGNIEQEDMYRTFNLGIGMVLCVHEAGVEDTLAILKSSGETAWLMGHVAASEHKIPDVKLHQ